MHRMHLQNGLAWDWPKVGDCAALPSVYCIHSHNRLDMGREISDQHEQKWRSHHGCLLQEL